MKCHKLPALFLALAMMFALAACRGGDGETGGDPSDGVTQSVEPSADPTGDVAADTIRLAVLSGPTGVGASKLLADSDAGDTINRYQYTIANDNSELVAGLTTGEIEIATMASNMAANLYHQTDGDVTIIAVGTLGVLHILEGGGGNSVHSMEDLRGKTIYAAGQGANPEYILRYLLTAHDIDPDHDVELIFGDAAEITQKLITGEAEVAMLPVPAAPAAIAKGEGAIRAALDVTDVWNSLNNGSQVVMTAVVARTAWIEENPQAVAAFLEEYAASIDYVNENVEEAAELVAQFGFAPSAAIARQAIPQCHLAFISGGDMVGTVSDFFTVLYQVDPTSIGGALPDDAIYYVP